MVVCWYVLLSVSLLGSPIQDSLLQLQQYSSRAVRLYTALDGYVRQEYQVPRVWHVDYDTV